MISRTLTNVLNRNNYAHYVDYVLREYADSTPRDDIFDFSFRPFFRNKSWPNKPDVWALDAVRKIFLKNFGNEGVNNVNDPTNLLFDFGLAHRDIESEDIEEGNNSRHSQRACVTKDYLENELDVISALEGACAHEELAYSIDLMRSYLLDRYMHSGPSGHGSVFPNDIKNLLGARIIKYYMELASCMRSPATLQTAKTLLKKLDQALLDLDESEIFKYASAQNTATTDATLHSKKKSSRKTRHLHETLIALRDQNIAIEAIIEKRLENQNVHEYIEQAGSVFNTIEDITFPKLTSELFIPEDIDERVPLSRKTFFRHRQHDNDINGSCTREYSQGALALYEGPLYLGASENYYETPDALEKLTAYLSGRVPKKIKSNSPLSEDAVKDLAKLFNRLYSLQAMLSKSTAVLLKIKSLTEEVGDIGISCIFDKFAPVLEAMADLLKKYQDVLEAIGTKCKALKTEDARIKQFREELAYKKLLVNLPRRLDKHIQKVKTYNDVVKSLGIYVHNCTPENIQERLHQAQDALIQLYETDLPNLMREISGSSYGEMVAEENFQFASQINELKDFDENDQGVSVYEEKDEALGHNVLPELPIMPLFEECKQRDHDQVEVEVVAEDLKQPDEAAFESPGRFSLLKNVLLGRFKKMFSRNLNKAKSHSLTEKEITDIEDEKLVLPEFEDESISLILQKRSYDDSCAFYKKKQHDLFARLSPELANYFNSEAFILNKAILKGEVSVFQRSFMEWVEMYQADPLVSSNETVWDDIREKGIRNLADLRICMTFIQFSMTQSLEKGDFEQLERTLNSANALHASAERIYGLVFSKLEALQDRPEKEDVPPESENTQQELENVEVQGKSNSLFVLTLPFFGKDQGGSSLCSQYGQNAKEYDSMAMSQEHEREPFILS